MCVGFKTAEQPRDGDASDDTVRPITIPMMMIDHNHLKHFPLLSISECSQPDDTTASGNTVLPITMVTTVALMVMVMVMALMVKTTRRTRQDRSKNPRNSTFNFLF